ncbi:MAG: thymidine kinase [Rhodobacteraceae bacterium]|nr:MAG: thymidine kinase [Paracoccaceae bacterium]
MAKLYFNYSTMNAGKSTALLQAAYNYRERGMTPHLITAKLDNRAGESKIVSRIGIEEKASVFEPEDNIYEKVKYASKEVKIDCVLLDEAQFLSKSQVWQLASIVDKLKIPVLSYGLRVDFRGELFPGSLTLLSIADEIKEIKTICHCGKKATMVVRTNSSGQIVDQGDQIQIGGNETYISLCRFHWCEEMSKA